MPGPDAGPGAHAHESSKRSEIGDPGGAGDLHWQVADYLCARPEQRHALYVANRHPRAGPDEPRAVESWFRHGSRYHISRPGGR